MKKYDKDEIKLIISLYEGGMSFSKIGKKLSRQKNTIKKILIKNNVWVENRDINIKGFNGIEIKKIISLYEGGMSATKISKIYNVSRPKIVRLLKNNGVNVKSVSDGKKIKLSENKKDEIKNLYLNKNKTTNEIAEILKLSEGFISKHINDSGYRRSKSKANSLARKGKKASPKARLNMKLAQIKLARSGNRKQTGGYCKYYKVHGLRCQGTYEKKYIEHLKQHNNKLPNNTNSINTPYGVYYPDFEYDDKYIEIKSSYTYDVLIGKIPSRFNGKYDFKQIKKIKWVNENVKPVDIIVINRNGDKLIKKN